MNVTKQTGYMITAVIALLIIAVTVLLALGRDPGRLIDLITIGLPTALLTLWAGNRADRAGQLAEKAAENAEQAVHNTNGRMGQMIQATIDRGGVVDVEEYADVIKHQDIIVPEEQAIHGGNPEPAFSEFDITHREDV